ncbi:MAG: hypothetical protein MHPDNHAH_01139 [Anaerolineales bacterium]|nr:hypothetical protein [Anaerolineales bacterium]
MSMSVPATIEFISRVQALTVMNQCKVGSLITVISIDLNKEIRRNIQANLYQIQGLLENIHANEVLAPL